MRDSTGISSRRDEKGNRRGSEILQGIGRSRFGRSSAFDPSFIVWRRGGEHGFEAIPSQLPESIGRGLSIGFGAGNRPRSLR